MRGRNDLRDTDERAPLFDANINKSDVLKFWSNKSYDLEIPEYLGNCTGCFLKDEADLARALIDTETDPQWWIDIEKVYGPMRRGGRTSYSDVFEEALPRMRIAKALQENHDYDIELPVKRHLTVVRQERAYLAEGGTAFSCSCEQAENFDDESLLA